jgi:hypothetical protein
MRRAGSRWLGAALLLATVAGCGARGRLALPTGAGEPDDGAAAAFAGAATACREAKTLTAEIALSGRANGRRVRGRLLVGVERPDRLRLEALAQFGAPLFVLVAREGRGSLWIPREQSAVDNASVPELVGAVAGLERSGQELVALLTGCVVPEGTTPEGGRRYAGGWRAVTFPGDTEVWLKDDPSPRIVAGRLGSAGGDAARGPVSVEYSDHQNGLPRTIRLLAGDATRSTDLTLRLTGVEVNTTLDANAFELSLPDNVRAMTVDELRRSGVFGSGT